MAHVAGAHAHAHAHAHASWLTWSQAWFESLRHYPSGANAIDCEAAYSGLTHGGGVGTPSEHLETDVRRCTHTHMRTYICICRALGDRRERSRGHMHTYICICMYVCICICSYVCSSCALVAGEGMTEHITHNIT